MSDVDQIDSEDQGLAFGYSADEAEPKTEPAPKPEEEASEEIKPEGQGDAPAPKDETPPPDAAAAQANDPAPKGDESDPMALIKKFDGRLRNLQGEVNKLNTQLTAQSNAAATAAAKEQGADAPTASQVAAAMRDGKKLAGLREEFPEWAEALDEQSSETERRILEKMPKTDGFATKDDIESFKKILPLMIKHPTFEEDINTPDFSDWLNAQDDSTKALAESESPKDAIALMDKFHARDKAPAGDKKPNPQERLARSLAPPTSGARAPARALSEEEAMSVGYKAS